MLETGYWKMKQKKMNYDNSKNALTVYLKFELFEFERKKIVTMQRKSFHLVIKFIYPYVKPLSKDLSISCE